MSFDELHDVLSQKAWAKIQTYREWEKTDDFRSTYLETNAKLLQDIVDQAYVVLSRAVDDENAPFGTIIYTLEDTVNGIPTSYLVCGDHGTRLPGSPLLPQIKNALKPFEILYTSDTKQLWALWKYK